MILPIRAPVGGYATTAFMTRAVDFAIAKHAGVINMSFTSGDDATLRDGIRKALAADIVLVAGSGNKGELGEYPGKYPEVVTVGAAGRDGKVASFSITGPQVDLVAPGVDIMTTANHAGYYTGQGTSAATAVVSGAAALLRAKYPDLSAAEIVHRLTATAVDAGPPGRDDAYGYGRLDIVRALTADVAPLPSSSVSGAAPSGAPAPTSAVDTSDLPKPASPLVLAGIVAAVVVLVGVVVLVLMVSRRRRSTE